MSAHSFFLPILALLAVMLGHISAGNNCKLTSSLSICESTDKVEIYPGQDPSVNYGMGLTTSISVIGGEGCSTSNLKTVNYKLSTPTHFDHCSIPVSPTPTGCNDHYTFQAVNTTFFSSSFMPLNTEAKIVTSSIQIDTIEDGCEVTVSMNFLWVSNVPSTCVSK